MRPIRQPACEEIAALRGPRLQPQRDHLAAVDDRSDPHRMTGIDTHRQADGERRPREAGAHEVARIEEDWRFRIGEVDAAAILEVGVIPVDDDAAFGCHSFTDPSVMPWTK